jgi:hypothetical protein
MTPAELRPVIIASFVWTMVTRVDDVRSGQRDPDVAVVGFD